MKFVIFSTGFPIFHRLPNPGLHLLSFLLKDLSLCLTSANRDYGLRNDEPVKKKNENNNDFTTMSDFGTYSFSGESLLAKLFVFHPSYGLSSALLRPKCKERHGKLHRAAKTH